ncbi:hypothetical protein JB92DRAFT_2665290, partial [Gautieria morchelliformis]
DKRRQDIYHWLVAPDYRPKHWNARTEREGDTGSWFIQGGSFLEWKSRAQSFLWLHGKPGAGKTVLCSTIIEELINHSLVIAYFYFDYHSKDIQPHGVLCALIEQLSSKCTSIPDSLEKLFSAYADSRRPPAPDELKSTLKAIICSFKNVYIVFDALDECPSRSEFLKLLEEIHGWNLDHLHLLATSRKEQDIEETLSGLVSREVFMDERLVGGDIQVHVSRILDNDVKFSRCSAEMKENIQTTLMKDAHGMFRWVVCQLDALRRCRSVAALEKALTCLPKTLYETYDRILLAISEDYRQDALNLLQWLAFSARTLSLSEAVDLLAIEHYTEQGPLFDPKRRLWNPHDILTICSSLVTIMDPNVQLHDGEDILTDDGEDILTEDSIVYRAQFPELGEVSLAHFSVREYLVSEHLRIGDNKMSCYHFNKKLADTFIAKACLVYLLQFDKHGCIDGNTCRSYPLSSYAARYWIFHVQPDNDEEPTLHRLIMALLQPKDAVYSNWLKLWNPDEQWEGDLNSMNCSPIYYMSMAGLRTVSNSLLTKGSDIN